MSEANPFRLFVTHAWEETEDYLRIFEYLEASGRFHYRNLARLDALPSSADNEARRESLRAQIGAAEIVIALASMYRTQSEWLTFQMTFAQAAKRPVLLMPLFGVSAPTPKSLLTYTNEQGSWDARAMESSIRSLARGESTGNWDVIEFKLD
jgi:hypothetical protein